MLLATALVLGPLGTVGPVVRELCPHIQSLASSAAMASQTPPASKPVWGFMTPPKRRRVVDRNPGHERDRSDRSLSLSVEPPSTRPSLTPTPTPLPTPRTCVLLDDLTDAEECPASAANEEDTAGKAGQDVSHLPGPTISHHVTNDLFRLPGPCGTVAMLKTAVIQVDSDSDENCPQQQPPTSQPSPKAAPKSKSGPRPKPTRKALPKSKARIGFKTTGV